MGVQKLRDALNGLKPVLLMVVVQFAYTGVNIFYKLAANDGMNLRIIIAYRFVFSTGFMLPLAFFMERKSRPKYTRIVLFQSFFCALFGGSMAQNLYIESLNLTSATFITAISNLIPALTFFLAVSFRLEKLNLRNPAGKAKLLGSLIGIGGAMLLTFYRGVEIDFLSTHIDLLHHGQLESSHVAAPQTDSGKRVWGCVFALGSSICYGFWLILQAKMNVKFPYYFSSAALMSTMGAIQAVGFALCTEREWDQWKLGWNIRLLTVAYSGVASSGIAVILVAWCVQARGPVFASAFYPLMLLLVAVSCCLLLNEKLHLGSVLGAIPIVLGLYLVLWGKSEEAKKTIQLVPADSLDRESIEIVVRNPSAADNKKTCSRDSNSMSRSSEKEHDKQTDSRTQERQ